MLLYAHTHTTPPYDTCCLATKPGILALPCTCIMGYKDHGLQAVLIELLPHSGDGTTVATGAGSPVKLAKLCTMCRPNKTQTARKTVREREFKGLGTDCAGTDGSMI